MVKKKRMDIHIVCVYIYMYMYITESLCCTSETNIVNQLYFNKKGSYA